MNEEQKQKLIEMAKLKLECILSEDFIRIRGALEGLEINKDSKSDKDKLRLHKDRYERNIKSFREEYGIEFLELEKQYNDLSQKINSYI